MREYDRSSTHVQRIGHNSARDMTDIHEHTQSIHFQDDLNAKGRQTITSNGLRAGFGLSSVSPNESMNDRQYTCDEGFAFPDETNEKTLTCGTDGQWTPSEPGDCSRVACDGEPPIPMASLNLIRQDWKSGKFAKFGTSVSYQCKPHTQVAEGITHFNLTCTDDQDKGVFIGEYYNSTLTQPFGACLEAEWSNPGYWRATYSEAPNIISSPAFAIDGKIDPQNPEVMPFAANGSGFLTIDLVENFIIEKVRLHFKESSTSKMLQVAVSVSSHSNQPCGSTGDKAPSSMHEFVCNIPYIGSKLGIVKSSSGPLAIDEILVIGTRFSDITCPQLVEPPNDLEKGNLVVSNRGTLFGTCIGNQAFQQFQSTPACPELEVYVYDEKYLSEHEVISIVELKANLSGEAEFFGAEVIFSHEVLTDTIVSDDLVKFEQGTNQRHLRLTFMADKLKGQTSTLKAKYKPIFSETLCIYDATCYKTQEEMDQASSLSTLGGTFDPSQSLMRAESVVNYTCGGSSAFEGSTDDVTISSIASTCQLDGTWDNPLVNEGLPKCKCASFLS
ncbi:hypothetical protein TCAL_16974 [Tigriopus californicus]|uniref:Sushi domain-containing protein n=1 Tax=Tigriopus californicus TaxID=6832 RepID=A0A553PG82_TIGCA|nr:hypothetical protein TCAL_16974 [Tigriopus californicus]